MYKNLLVVVCITKHYLDEEIKWHTKSQWKKI